MSAALDVPELIPARMLNEYAYCPRLAYLEWSQGEFADNFYTEDGRHAHRRVDEGAGYLAPPEDDQAPQVVRSVMLSAPRAGIIARMDLIEAEGGRAVPVDFKRGEKPKLPEGAYEPERVQIAAQAMVLRENGFTCERGVIYFVGSKERVDVPIDDALLERTRQLASALKDTARSQRIPPPLDDSPKCNGCSLAPICLPDETLRLATGHEGSTRRLVPVRDDALPAYVQTQGAVVGRSGERLVVKERGQQVGEIRLFETSQLNVLGNIQVTTQAIQELCSAGVPVCWFSMGGWFYGMTLGHQHKNIELRQAQFRAAASRGHSTAIARRMIAAKIKNCRTLLRRNAKDVDPGLLARLRVLVRDALHCRDLASLLGVEGTAARLYFEALPLMLKREQAAGTFDFEGRNRRPPRDPVNALLSFAYSLLTKDATVALLSAGFDPYLGFYHQPRYGRASLALDLIEEFRPLVGDSVVISAINGGVVTDADFVRAAGAVALRPAGRKKFIAAYERRMDQLVRHPLFGYRLSYRRLLELQARLLGRHVMGEIPRYPSFVTR